MSEVADLPLSAEFVLPDKKTYFLGNSLGLQPKKTAEMVVKEMERWAKLGVSGYFQGDTAWLNLDQQLKPEMARLVGAEEDEVAITGTLTGNIHLLFSRFYRPSKRRRKILVEYRPFPSDWYAMESQIRAHGFDPADCLVELQPREGERTLRDEDIVAMIGSLADELAVVFLGAVQYFTCQLFDIAGITAAAHAVGSLAIFDCAHAVGVVPLNLRTSDVDAAVWCSYKWLNGGPGAVGGLFVNRRLFPSGETPPAGQLLGWWGHEEKTRFKMDNHFVPAGGADCFRLSNAPIFSLVSLLASLRVFARTSIGEIRVRSLQLTRYLIDFVETSEVCRANIQVITPCEDHRRGGHVSLLLRDEQTAQTVLRALETRGFVVDYRAPGVLRVAPSPLYNTDAEVHEFCRVLEDVLAV
jgi:kynureninase